MHHTLERNQDKHKIPKSILKTWMGNTKDAKQSAQPLSSLKNYSIQNGTL